MSVLSEQPNQDHAWLGAGQDSFRIDILIRRINELSEDYEENAVKILTLLKNLCMEIVSKLVVKNAEKQLSQALTHDLINRSRKLFFKVVVNTTLDGEDILELDDILFTCLYYKQNMLKLGLRWEDDEDIDLRQV